MTAFTTHPTRAYDTERKILEHLYATYGAATKPSVVYLFSIINICGNCASVISQYQTRTGIPVIARSDGRFPSGADLGRFRTSGGSP